MRRLQVVLFAVALLAGVLAHADCLPSGRDAFAAGLEALRRGDLTTAAKVFYQLVQEQPTCAEARNNLAVVFVEEGRIEDAAVQLREALRLKPDYQRARLNLRRLETLSKDTAPGRPGGPIPLHPSAPREAEGVLQGGDQQNEKEEPTAAQPESKPLETEWGGAEVVDAMPQIAEGSEGKPADARPLGARTGTGDARPTAPKGGTAAIPTPTATPDARNTAACVIEPAQNRVCVYQRTPAGMANEECFAIAPAQVRTWPRWVVASEVTPKRIRLLDETGQTRLEIAVEDTPVSGDTLRMHQADFEALASRVLPWRTGWLILE